MRRRIVLVVLLLMGGALAVLRASRGSEGIGAASAGGERSAQGATSNEGSAEQGKGEGSADEGSTRKGKGGGEADGDAGAEDAEPLLDRPLRVVSLGWEALTPGVLANGGLEPSDDSAFAERRLEVQLRSVQDLEGIEKALAKGGAQEQGADVALVPLPTMVAAYERLRALEPHVFFVVGWSHGREALYGKRDASLLELPRRGEVRLAAERGRPQTFVARFLLGRSGIGPDRLARVSPDDAAASKAPWAAVDRAAKDADDRAGSRKAVVTTADASALVPWVAVAPGGLLEGHDDALAAWADGWLEGVRRLRDDVPAAAREVAKIDGAPQAVTLLRHLGQLDFVGLVDNARRMGLSGRGAVTIEALFGHCWDVWRGAGVLTTPAPQAPPLFADVVMSLVREDPASFNEKARGDAGEDEPSFDTDPLLRHVQRGRPVDEAALVQSLGLLAGVFERSALRVAIRGRTDADELVVRAVERYSLAEARFETARRPPRGASASIEVLAAP